MSRWFRHYAGMMRDDKLVRVAIKSKQPIERVVWLWGAILESAAEIDDGGRFDLDAAEAAYFLRADEVHVAAILDSLIEGGRISEGHVVKWGDRQFQSDRSAERQRRHREKQKSTNDGDHNPKAPLGDDADNVTVTSPSDGVTAVSRHGDAPETETELEADTETKAAQHSEPREKLGGIPIVLWRGERTGIWFDQLETECREAAGLENDPSSALCNPSPIVTLIDRGYDFARDILPVLRAFKAKGKAGKTWDYYVSAITEGKARNDKIEPKAAASPVAETIWLTDDDPLFIPASANYERETGKRCFSYTSRHRNGQGFEFPASCVPTRKDEQEAA
jgi:hypothetical protein